MKNTRPLPKGGDHDLRLARYVVPFFALKCSLFTLKLPVMDVQQGMFGLQSGLPAICETLNARNVRAKGCLAASIWENTRARTPPQWVAFQMVRNCRSNLAVANQCKSQTLIDVISKMIASGVPHILRYDLPSAQICKADNRKTWQG
jgi:hypothetical protein